MSELVLVLRSRLREVADWVEIPADVLLSARKRVGSRETVARMLNMSAKTLERYEADGRIPRHMVDQFSDVLHLNIERPEPVTVTLPEARAPGQDVPLATAEELAELREQVAELAGSVANLERAVGEKLDLLLAQRGPEAEAPRSSSRSQ